MRSKVSAVGTGSALVIALLAFAAAARGQDPARPDVLGSLLVEVRGLRAAIEQMASASGRVQLVMGRLQIQEQRVNTLSRQLFEIRGSLAAAERQYTEQEARLADLEDVLPSTSEAGERKAIEQEIAQLKMISKGAASALQRLRAEEADLAGVVSAEQARWVEFNQQLDALDQALRRQ